jgi:23S rRNA (adenine1618-N6)-methyltransferase
MRSLVQALPALGAHVIAAAQSRSGRETIDFADPQAVRALNHALLRAQYGVREWMLPDGALCPPVPGRADYLHHLADILAESSEDGRTLPRGAAVRGLDVGTGASFIYPLIGASCYGWSFVGTESECASAESAERIRVANACALQSLGSSEVRLQPDSRRLLRGLCADPRERFDFVMANPPFYRSAEEYARENARKRSGLAANLVKRGRAAVPPAGAAAAAVPTSGSDRNFGGVGAELWCPGGEVSFVGALIDESEEWAERALWFSSLVSRTEHVSLLRAKLESKRELAEGRIVQMGQGQKRTSLLLWTYWPRTERRAWASRRGWGGPGLPGA